MSSFKDKLLQEVVNPAANSRRASYIVGTITKANNTNKCKVDFTDNNGFERKNETVEIQIYGDGVWFPKKGDKVVIMQMGNNFVITSKYIRSWSDYKEKTSLKVDIFSNLVTDFVSGFIF